jgi:hypothetical protein
MLCRARGQNFDGKLRRGRWGCACAHRFCAVFYLAVFYFGPWHVSGRSAPLFAAGNKARADVRPCHKRALNLYIHKTERDPHEEIVRLEEHIAELDAKIESCRKFILASRIAMVAGGIVFAAMLVGAVRFDPGTMAAAAAGILGGIVVWGSNRSTSKEAAKELTAAEVDRAALIEIINPRVIQ